MESSVVYLEDILQSMDRISTYIKGYDFENFSINQMVIDAVIRNLEVIGEASKNIPADIREKYKKVPWVEMTASGRYMIDEYASVDAMAVWDIVILLLGQLRPHIIDAINTEESS